MVKLEQSWLDLLADQFEQPYFKQIKEKLLQEKAEHHVVYPPGSKIFAALDYCPVDKVKAVIIGQDPYHNPGQAHGLCFSVRAHMAASHAGIGWQQFTDTVIQRLSEVRENLVFLLWGSFAIKKQALVAPNRGHLILTAPHPSPLSAYRGFFGCKHFSKANEYLKSKGLEPIDWSIK